MHKTHGLMSQKDLKEIVSAINFFFFFFFNQTVLPLLFLEMSKMSDTKVALPPLNVI